MRHREVALVYAAGLVQGLALVAFPAASDIFTSPDFHDLSSSEYGSLFLPMVVAAILASTLSGPAARRMTALGLGFGSTLTALNALAMAYFPKHPERALTALHALLGTGTALAPLLVALVSRLGAWWALPAVVAAVLGLLVAGGVTLPLAPAAAADGIDAREPIDLAGAVRVLGLFVTAGIVYGIVETIFANWAVIYLREDAGVSVRSAGYALTAFWAMVTAGRLLVAAVGGWLSPKRVYVTLPGLMIAAFLWIASVDGAAGGIGAFALAGLACSAFLPLSIGFAQACHRNLAEIVSGVMIAAYMLGFGIGSYGLGPLREAAGIPLATLYAWSAALAILLMGIALVLARRRAAPRACAH